jgi:hypothetical protein
MFILQVIHVAVCRFEIQIGYTPNPLFQHENEKELPNTYFYVIFASIKLTEW